MSGSSFEFISSGIANDSGPGKVKSIASKEVFHGPGDPKAVKGDGNGVISTSGPTPGEDRADPGDREPALLRDAERADLKLPLRPGRCELEDAWYKEKDADGMKVKAEVCRAPMEHPDVSATAGLH
ncbi:MAG: hypothetical protein Q9190_005801 [Brigantiaea leucoxantha]